MCCSVLCCFVVFVGVIWCTSGALLFLIWFLFVVVVCVVCSWFARARCVRSVPVICSWVDRFVLCDYMCVCIYMYMNNFMVVAVVVVVLS